MAKFFLKPLAWAADVVIVGEVRRTSVAARPERVHLLRSIIQEFPASERAMALPIPLLAAVTTAI